MPYIPSAWVDGPGGNTPITASQLTRLETQYTQAVADAAVAGSAAFVGQVASGIVVPSGATFSDIQTACTSAATFGTRVSAAGTITTSSTLLITSSCDLSGLTINYTGSGVAVQIGTGSSTRVNYKTMVLPSVINTVKTITGWSQVANSVGVRVTNGYACTITVPRIRNFATGLEVRGEGTGNVYNTYILGSINNTLLGVAFTNDSTGWTNQNTFVGGALQMDSAEGNAAVGSRAVMVNTASNLPNTNTFIGTSFEGNGWEYQIEMFGQYNTFLNCRFEASLGAKVYWRAAATRNAILQGYGTITPTYESGAVRNSIEQTGQRRNLTVAGTSGVFNLQNDSSASNASVTILDPSFSVEAGNDPATSFSWAFAANALHGKRGGDTNDRVQLDSQNGRIYFANGTASPSYYIGNFGTTGMGIGAGHLSYVTDNTFDFGIASQRARYIRAGTAVVTGSFATGSRPAAATAGVGASVFDSTLGKPIWSTGSVWVDATGATV